MENKEVAVTYTGNDNPYKDRIYRTNLTFEKGQTRMMPPELAARFLRHTDVFVQGEVKAKPKAKAEKTEEVAELVDDTQEILAKRDDSEAEQRELDNNRYSLFDQLESMDKPALIEWTLTHYKQKMPGNYGLPKLQDMAKGFVEQYGMPA